MLHENMSGLGRRDMTVCAAIDSEGRRRVSRGGAWFPPALRRKPYGRHSYLILLVELVAMTKHRMHFFPVGTAKTTIPRPSYSTQSHHRQ